MIPGFQTILLHGQDISVWIVADLGYIEIYFAIICKTGSRTAVILFVIGKG